MVISSCSFYLTTNNLGRISSVVTVTRYRPDGWGSKSGDGDIFRKRPDRPWGQNSLLYSRYRVFPRSKAARAVTLTTHHLLAPKLKKEKGYTCNPPLGLHAMFTLLNIQRLPYKEQSVTALRVIITVYCDNLKKQTRV